MIPVSLAIYRTKIFAIHFDFASLEIGWFRAHRISGGKSFASPIEVQDHLIAVLSGYSKNQRCANQSGFLRPP